MDFYPENEAGILIFRTPEPFANGSGGVLKIVFRCFPG